MVFSLVFKNKKQPNQEKLGLSTKNFQSMSHNVTPDEIRKAVDCVPYKKNTRENGGLLWWDFHFSTFKRKGNKI